MKQLIEKAFPLITQNQCLESLTNSEFGFFDFDGKGINPKNYIKGKCYIFDNDDIIHFTVKNPNQKEIHFLAIDKCLFFDETKKCDCAVFDNKTICFIEIKETDRNKSFHNKNAREQLLKSIKDFKEKIDFSGKRLEAYMVVGVNFAKTTPASKARDLITQLEFEDLGVVLFQNGNEKIFN